MLGDGFGFRHARIVNDDNFIAARANQKRRERKNKTTNCKKYFFISLATCYFQPVIREPDSRRQFRLRLVVVVIMRQMREISSSAR